MASSRPYVKAHQVDLHRRRQLHFHVKLPTEFTITDHVAVCDVRGREWHGTVRGMIRTLRRIRR